MINILEIIKRVSTVNPSCNVCLNKSTACIQMKSETCTLLDRDQKLKLNIIPDIRTTCKKNIKYNFNLDVYLDKVILCSLKIETQITLHNTVHKPPHHIL